MSRSNHSGYPPAAQIGQAAIARIIEMCRSHRPLPHLLNAISVPPAGISINCNRQMSGRRGRFSPQAASP